MNTVLPVISLLLAQASPTRGVEETWPSEFAASFSGGGFHQAPAYDGWRAGGGVGANWYLRQPLVDDGTPLTMLAFLQRLDRLSFDVSAVGFGGKDSSSLDEYSGHSANASFSGLFYLHDLVLGGGIHYSRAYDLQHPADGYSDERHTTQVAYPELTLGVRSGTLQCEGIYRFLSYFDDGKARSPRWGQVAVGLRNFSDTQTYWNAFLYTLVHGAGLSFDFEFFASPRLGVWLNGYLESGVVYANYANSQTDYERTSFSLGVGWWQSSRFELQFSVSVSTAQQDSAVGYAGSYPTLVTGLGTFGVVLRAPKRYRALFASPLADPLPADDAD